jgi:hypothetical protein
MKPDPSSPQAAGTIPKVIVRAEPTLARILKTLDSDYLKIQVILILLILSLNLCESFSTGCALGRIVTSFDRQKL